MALYLRWTDLKAGISSALKPTKGDEKENVAPKSTRPLDDDRERLLPKQPYTLETGGLESAVAQS